MRSIVTLFAFGAVGVALSGCQFGGPSGVFEHTNVPPPPSMSGEVKTSTAQGARSTAPASPARRAQTPEAEQASTAAPEPAVQPVMTGSGMGAGFRF